MKNFSAVKLLQMALHGIHIPNCPNFNSSIPGTECKCWKNEVYKWEKRLFIRPNKRILKSHIIKDHTTNLSYCGKLNPKYTTTSIVTDTCHNCSKHT